MTNQMWFKEIAYVFFRNWETLREIKSQVCDDKLHFTFPLPSLFSVYNYSTVLHEQYILLHFFPKNVCDKPLFIKLSIF